MATANPRRWSNWPRPAEPGHQDDADSLVHQLTGRGRAARDTNAKVQQLPTDALVAPPWVLGGQPNDHGLDLVGNRWSAAWPGWIGPMSTHHAAVPSKQRLGRDHEDGPLGPGHQTAERRQQRAVLGLEPRPWVLAAQNCSLVAEDQDLHLFGVR
jgi:hypothetical protein